MADLKEHNIDVFNRDLKQAKYRFQYCRNDKLYNQVKPAQLTHRQQSIQNSTNLNSVERSHNFKAGVMQSNEATTDGGPFRKTTQNYSSRQKADSLLTFNNMVSSTEQHTT